MNICAVFRIQQNGENGYIAVVAPDDTFPKCSSYEEIKNITSKRLKAYKFLGDIFGNDFEEFTGSVVRTFMCEIVTSKNEFGTYIKYWSPNRYVNPYKLGRVVIDLPYIYVDGKKVVEWVPVFDKDFTYESFNIVSGGAIVEYNFKRQIFVLEHGESRHKPRSLEERLIFDTDNDRITREVHEAGLNEFIDTNMYVSDGYWVTESSVKSPIVGYKME